MKNQVELLGYYGGDKRVCLSAWQSTTDELGLDINEIPQNARVDVIFDHLAKQKKKTPQELLDMLATAGHHTPFEKLLVDFQVSADVASHIHCLKHRIAHINGESARYKELIDKNYIPDDWDIPVKSDRVLALYDIKDVTWADILKKQSEINNFLYHTACEELVEVHGRKRAKESSRYFLMYNKQMNYDFQMNWRSFMNFQRLRNDSHAQKEIREIANTMLKLVEEIKGNPFEGCLKAFNLKST